MIRNLFFISLFVLMTQDTSAKEIQTVYGIAKNAKMGAIVLTEKNVPYYLENLESWEDNVLNIRVSVKGRVITIKGKNKPLNPPSTEMLGNYYLIKNWKLISSKQ